MCDTEGVPEDDVGVVDDCVAIRDPFRDTSGWLARCLRDVPTCWVDLVV